MREMVISALLAVGATVTPVSAQRSADYVPFRVTGSSKTEVRVDVGAREEHAKSLRRATVLTLTGAVRARFTRTERICEWLCGEGEKDGKECHYEVVLRASGPVNTALAVLAGTPEVGEVAEPQIGSERSIEDTASFIEADPIRINGRSFQWTRRPGGAFLSWNDGDGVNVTELALTDCKIRPVAPFTILSCPNAQLLYERSRGIAISIAEYGDQTVDPLLRFRLDGREAVAIRLGLKAAVAIGLLIKDDHGVWRLNFREFDYALLC